MTTKVVPSPKNEERNVAKEALNYLIEGKRHLVVQDYPSAVSSFQESCKLYTEKYGEMANECGEVYFFYGKALLELARLEIGVLGNALEGVPSEDDDAESEDDQVENPENVTEKEGENPEDEEDEDLDEEQNKETEEVVKNNVKERGLSELQPSTSSGEKSTKDDEEDEISNLQLAWEVLELAKVICKRQADGGDYLMRLKTSEVLLKLGEVSIESENYSQAVNDLNECLQMRKELLQPDDRNLADAFFQLGLAYSLDNQFDNAIEHYEKAIQVIEDRIVNLQKSLKDKLQDSQDDSVNIIKEIDELKEIIPDIKSKIEDTADIKRNFEETMREAAAKRLHTSEENNLSNTDDDSTSQNVSPTKAATSIAHLVKRKRKPDEVDEQNSDLQAKKPRPDEDNTSLTSDKTEANGKIQTSVDVGEKLEAQAKKRTDIQTT
ncbi:protein HGV2-like isoform X6 [Tachypleus tridentatus]|uniref:protein HGV2-like isoform X6 n=1 Tax=Tachypleus tridentatus TaxID=6853 RepID=UPI003FD219A3